MRKHGNPCGNLDKVTHNGRKRLRCLAVLALAMAFLLPTFFIADDSSAVAGDEELDMEFLDSNGNVLTTPLFNSRIPFSTVTTPNGVMFELEPGTQINDRPAYFVIRTVNGADHGLFRVTVKIEGIQNSWMNECGIRVSSDNGIKADLTADNSYMARFKTGNNDAYFELGEIYSISFASLNHVIYGFVPENVDGIKVILFAESVEPPRDTRTVRFISDDTVVEERTYGSEDILDTLPTVTKSGSVFTGWLDFDGNVVTEEMLAVNLPADPIGEYVIQAQWDGQWPIITETTDETSEGGKEYTYREVHQDGSSKEIYSVTSGETIDDDGNIVTSTTTTQYVNEFMEDYSSVTTVRDPDDGMIITERGVYNDIGQGTVVEPNLLLVEVIDGEGNYRLDIGMPELDDAHFQTAKELYGKYASSMNCGSCGYGSPIYDGVSTFTKQSLATIVDEEGSIFARLNLDNGEELYVSLDKDVVKWLYNNCSDTDLVTLKIKKATDADMSDAQMRTVGDAYAVNITLTIGDTSISELGEGLAEVRIKNGNRSAEVFFVNVDGSSEFIDCYYGKDNSIVYVVDHFSIFMIEEEKSDNGFAWPYVIIVIAELILIPLLAILYYRRRRRKEEETI